MRKKEDTKKRKKNKNQRHPAVNCNPKEQRGVCCNSFNPECIYGVAEALFMITNWSLIAPQVNDSLNSLFTPLRLSFFVSWEKGYSTSDVYYM